MDVYFVEIFIADFYGSISEVEGLGMSVDKWRGREEEGRRTIMLSVMLPSSSYHLSKRQTMVLFPAPDAPTIAVCFPAGKRRHKLSRTLTSALVGYAKLTFSRTMSS